MRLNTRMRYGTRALTELARHYGRGAVSLGEIAARQGISRKYLEAILSDARNARLVRSRRGAHGGFLLARPPEEITLRDIYVVLEGSDAYAPCVADGAVCDRLADCPTRAVWARMQEAAMDVLQATSLADLAAGTALALEDEAATDAA